MAKSPDWAALQVLEHRANRIIPVPPPTRIFGFEGADAEDVIYVNWLNMVRAGLLALEFYTPEAANWRQVGLARSHLQDREGACCVAIVRILGAGMGQMQRNCNPRLYCWWDKLHHFCQKESGSNLFCVFQERVTLCNLAVL